MVDIDIQGSEYALLDRATVRMLTKHVRRVHVGTHPVPLQSVQANIPESTEYVRAETVVELTSAKTIEEHFTAAGWDVTWSFAKSPVPQPTPYGPVAFADGVLSLINRKVPEACRNS